MEAELRSTRARAEAAEASGQALQGELHAGEVEHVKLGQQLAETERSAATAAAGAAGVQPLLLPCSFPSLTL